MRVHLVDGTYELFRAYFGAPPRHGRDGREVGAAVGLLFSLAALLREPRTTHAAVAFDHVIESFRNRLYDGYKTGEGIEPELRAQFELAERVASALGLVVWSMVEYEADDAIATAATTFAADSEVEQIVICSPDKDLAQCVVGDRVVCLDRRRRITLDECGVKAKFGVEPSSIPDWLALVGDSSDGIPGIPRWGAKSAAAVLSRYLTIEAIPRLSDDWDVKVRGAAALAENLSSRIEEAGLYKQLTTLRRDVYLAQSLSELAWSEVDGDRLEVLAAELELDDLRRRIGL